MPLQSKVNDMLMDVLIQRTVGMLASTDCDGADVAQAVTLCGHQMGFSIKLEQYWRGRAESLRDALGRQPFLFIGYYFYARAGSVRVCCDVPRTLAQVPYPSQKWFKEREELSVMEAMRLGSIALNLGVPPAELEVSFDAFRREASSLIERALMGGDRESEQLRWVVQESPFALAVDARPSLSGLLRSLTRDPRVLWLHKEPELLSVSELKPLTWADEVEEEESGERRALGLAPSVRPASDSSVRALRIPSGRVPTHPATSANDGRPPPTVVWGPPKAPRAQESVSTSRRTRRRDGMAFREYHQMLEEDHVELGESDFESDE